MDDILGKDIGLSINGTKTRYSSASHNTDLQQHLGKKRKRNRSKTYVPCSSQKALESAYDFWTLEELVDELVYRLGSINSYVINTAVIFDLIFKPVHFHLFLANLSFLDNLA
jgi:hypothetical protein